MQNIVTLVARSFGDKSNWLWNQLAKICRGEPSLPIIIRGLGSLVWLRFLRFAFGYRMRIRLTNPLFTFTHVSDLLIEKDISDWNVIETGKYKYNHHIISVTDLFVS